MMKDHIESVAGHVIKETASQMLMRKGLNNTSLEDISAALHVETSYIRLKFPSMDHMLRSIIDDFCHDVGATIADFCRKEISALFADGKAALYRDRIHFDDAASVKNFAERLLDYKNERMSRPKIRVS